MSTIRHGALACLLLAFGLIAAPLQAAEKSNDSAMRVAVDSKTGKLRPVTASERAKLETLEQAGFRSATRSTNTAAPGVLRRFPSGYEGMDVPSNLHSVLTATVNADGSISIEHSDPAEASHEN